MGPFRTLSGVAGTSKIFWIRIGKIQEGVQWVGAYVYAFVFGLTDGGADPRHIVEDDRRKSRVLRPKLRIGRYQEGVARRGGEKWDEEMETSTRQDDERMVRCGLMVHAGPIEC